MQTIRDLADNNQHGAIADQEVVLGRLFLLELGALYFRFVPLEDLEQGAWQERVFRVETDGIQRLQGRAIGGERGLNRNGMCRRKLFCVEFVCVK
jgi:hypothetical protein